MPKIQLIAENINVLPIYWALQKNPHLWNQNPARTIHPDSPHYGLDDIWVRYGSASQSSYEPHDSKWHECADVLGVKQICLDLMHALGYSVLGGVLITRIPAGAECKPHSDDGWHANVHDKFGLQITSAPGQEFCFEGEKLESKPGDLFKFENEHLHWVTNPTKYERITMIICFRKE